MSSSTGWFASKQVGQYFSDTVFWCPAFYDGGHILLTDMEFSTERDCRDYIEEVIVPMSEVLDGVPD